MSTKPVDFPPYPGHCPKCGEPRERDIGLASDYQFDFRWVCIRCDELDWNEPED